MNPIAIRNVREIPKASWGWFAEAQNWFSNSLSNKVGSDEPSKKSKNNVIL